MAYSIAIDGPAGAGKSTIAKSVAQRLSFIYVDTGAMYRAMAVYFMDNQVDTDSEEAVRSACQQVDIEIIYENGVQQVIVNGVNVTGRLRTEETGRTASKTAAYSAVRSKLVEIQRRLAQNSDVIMDGRDIGTCVLPNATAKVYLTASVSARAMRRFKELEEKGEKPDLKTISGDIEKRDYNDMHRQNSPLMQAGDAVYLDSSDMGIEEVTERIIEIFLSRKEEA